MSLFYVYVFYYTPPPPGTKLPEHDLHYQPEGEKFVYASSEVEARKKYKEAFGVNAGDLIERRRW